MNEIKKLEILGFKSFHNKKELSIPNGLTIIVGPNGSGKSNVLEAITFVLGKSSKKDLRASRLSDLVFSGSKKLPPSDSAKITIEIDNTNRAMPIDDDIVKISRKVSKEGASIFRVNGKREVMEYVRNLLSHANIDPDGFNIVLQGEIQKFIDYSPEEKRMIIEDISGVAAFENKKHKCMLEIEKVDQAIRDARIHLNEKWKFMENLQKEKDQAEEFAKIEYQLKFKKASKLFKEKEGFEEELNKESKKLDSKQKEINVESEKRNKLNSETLRLNEETGKISREIEEKGEKEQIELSNKIQNLKVRQGELRFSIKTAEENLRKNAERRKNLIQQIETNKQNVANFEKAVKENTKKLEEQNKKIVSDEEKLEKLKNLDKERLSLLSKIFSIERELGEKDRQLYDFEEDLREKREIEQYKKDLEKIQRELKGKLEADAGVSLALGELRENHAMLSKSMHHLEGRREAVLNLLKHGVRSIIEIKSQNKIKGIHGLVSGLGKVDEEYALPLKVAGGNKVNSIVVDDEDVAKDCIDYLKREKRGFATFLPLSRLKPTKFEFDEKLNEIKGVLGFAIDLIKFNKKYDNVFKYVFANTLVVEDIETAKKVGINKIRMVTLDGELIEKSGAMTGGYRKKEISEFKETGIEEQIEKLVLELKKLGNQIFSHDSEHANLSDEIFNLRTKENGFMSKIREINIDISAYEKLKKDIDEKKKERDSIKSEMDSLPKKVDEALSSKLKGELDKERAEAGKLSSQINGDGIQTRITNGEIGQTQGVLKQLEKEILLFTNSLDEDKKELVSVERNLGETDKEETKFHEKLRQLFETRKKLNETIQNNEIKKVGIDNLISKLRDESQVFEIKINEFKAKIESRLIGLEDYKEIEIKDVKESLEKLDREITELQIKHTNFGPVNMRALESYKEAETEYNNLKERVDKLDVEKNSVINAMNEVESQKKESFMEAFENIAKYFAHNFDVLAPGGEGKLTLENPENPFEAGIDLVARFAGNPMVSLRAMSGGQKTLTTIAFIFAIHSYKPSPFYIFDEIDAALDKENSAHLGKLLTELSSTSQFIVISHNDNITSEAATMYGVTVNALGESQILTIKLPEEKK
jgi:chromosome segregation protein